MRYWSVPGLVVAIALVTASPAGPQPADFATILGHIDILRVEPLFNNVGARISGAIRAVEPLLADTALATGSKTLRGYAGPAGSSALI